MMDKTVYKEQLAVAASRIKSKNFEFRITYYLSKGFRLYVRGFLGFFFFSLLAPAGLAIPVFYMPQIWKMPVVILFFVLFQLIIFPSFYLVARNIDKKKRYSFLDFFKGIRSLGQFILLLLYLTMAVVGLGLIVFLLFYFAEVPFPTEGSQFIEEIGNLHQEKYFQLVIFTVLSFLAIMIYCGIAYSFVVPFIMFWKVNFWKALRTSFRVVSRKWFYFFLFYNNIHLLYQFLLLPVFLASFIIFPTGQSALYEVYSILVIIIISGSLFFFYAGFIPVYYCFWYAAFEDIVGVPAPVLNVSENLKPTQSGSLMIIGKQYVLSNHPSDTELHPLLPIYGLVENEVPMEDESVRYLMRILKPVQIGEQKHQYFVIQFLSGSYENEQYARISTVKEQKVFVEKTLFKESDFPPAGYVTIQ